MTVHVDRLVTDVSLSTEPPAKETAREDPRWEQDQRLRQNRQRLQRLELRTRAEGFDD
jgi:hypothetical protein